MDLPVIKYSKSEYIETVLQALDPQEQLGACDTACGKVDNTTLMQSLSFFLSFSLSFFGFLGHGQ